MQQYVMVIESMSIVKVELGSELAFPIDSVRFRGITKTPKHNPVLPGMVPVVAR